MEAKYCDDDFVDEEDETRPSSGVLILALGCEISANLEPHFVSRVRFSQQLWPDPHESNTKHVTPPLWMRQTADGGRLLAQVTRDKIFFRICNLQNSFLDLATILGFANLCEICKIIFVNSIILLRFVILFQIS